MFKILATVSFVALSSSALAKPTLGNQMKSVDLGGVMAMCGLKASAAEDLKSVETHAGEAGFDVVKFPDGDEKKFRDVFNATEPVSHLADKIVEAIKSDTRVVLFVMDAGRLCVAAPMSLKVFNELADKAFGAGS